MRISRISRQSLPELEAVRAELARRSLRRFIEEAWHVIEPTTPFCPGWHIDAICEHLEAVSNGQIRDLLINMPPRHMKSTIISVMWPVWEWITWPSRRWLFASYAASLSTRDSLKCRRLIESPWFQKRYGHCFQLAGDQNAKNRFENTETGYRLATSVGGSGTGEGGDRIVVDDPHNVTEAQSKAVIESTIDWWDETMSTRGNDPNTVARIIVMQRVSDADLSGHVLAKGGYEHLCLPAEYEARRTIYIGGKPQTVVTSEVKTSIGWRDPRTEDGQLLWPQRFGAEAMRKLKLSLGSYGVAGQLQQRPAPRGGGVLKSSWMPRFRVPPTLKRRCIYIDTAQKTSQRNDYSVLLLAGLGSDNRVYALDLLRGKWEAHDLEKHTIDFWNKHRGYDFRVSCPLSKMLVEDASAGTGLIQNIRKKGGIPIKGITRTRDKLVRAFDVQSSLEAGLFLLPEEAPWVADFTKEVDEFTKDDTHPHDDQVDVMLDAVTDLLLGGGGSIFDSV